MSNVMIKMVNVQKKFGEQIVVDNLSLDVEQGEFLTLLGPSGCGKTTTLRMIAGFEQPSSGEILLDGEHMEGKAPYERNVNTVFQNYALFPHMNVYENIAFGLKMKKVPKDKIGDMVFDMLRLVQLEGYERRMPNQLSGGQKQRIAIARAVINKPKVLLLDEPLGALDLKLRKQMQVELKHLQRKLGITFIYVTHDQEEALTMSDRIAVMSEGVLQQVGMPDEIYEKPVNRFVADFIGETNLFEGKVTGVDGEYGVIATQEGSINVLSKGLENGESVSVAIRPERLSVSYEKPYSLSYVCGRLKERIYVGSISKIVIELKSGKEVVVNETAGKKFDISNADGDIYVTWEAHNGVVMKG